MILLLSDKDIKGERRNLPLHEILPKHLLTGTGATAWQRADLIALIRHGDVSVLKNKHSNNLDEFGVMDVQQFALILNGAMRRLVEGQGGRPLVDVFGDRGPSSQVRDEEEI